MIKALNLAAGLTVGFVVYDFFLSGNNQFRLMPAVIRFVIAFLLAWLYYRRAENKRKSTVSSV